MSTQHPSIRANGSTEFVGRLRASHVAQQSANTQEAEGVSDELAALFLGEEHVDTDSMSAPTHAPKLGPSPELDGGDNGRVPTISLLVLGNLPVFAAAWASQLARDRQEQLGHPLGLLTVTEESARLEVFGFTGSPVVEAPSLKHAMGELARLGADLLVRLPEAEAGWVSAERQVSSVTLLTGADDPAIVAAYRSLKAIVQDLPADADVAQIRVAIAGSQPVIAQQAAAKLVQAATRFLGLSVESEQPVVQIDAGASAELYHGAPPNWADLPDLFAHFAGQSRMAPTIESRTIEHDTLEPRTQPQPVGFEAQGVSSLGMPQANKPGEQDHNPVAAERSMPVGLRPIEVACPYANAVGLAVDHEGVLHAVAWAQDAGASSSAVRDLVVASSWLRDHADLVAVILGKRLAGEPSVRHLVLAHGRGALGLAQGELRVHVSVPGSGALVDLN